MSAPLPGEQITVNVTISVNSTGTVNLSFTDIPPEDLPALLCSVGTEEFARKMSAQLQEDAQKRRQP
jgi:hypothetical protein